MSINVPTTRYYVSYVHNDMIRFVSSENGRNTKDKTKVHHFNKRMDAKKSIELISKTCRYTIHKQRAAYVHKRHAVYSGD